MTAQNPGMHARVAADALDRMMREVTSGRARWSHPTQLTQTADDFTRAADAMAGALQQMAAAMSQLSGPGVRDTQTVNALHLAGQSAATAAQHLRQARRTMH